MDKIRLHDLIFKGRHGVTAKERMAYQRFRIQAELSVDLQEAGVADLLSFTVNYSTIRKLIRDVVTEKSFKTLEAMAAEISWRVFAVSNRIKGLKLAIAKLDIWEEGGYPEIEIHRTRD